ncbi:MAG TPA: glycosyltransferase family 4 protein [Sedimentisphaerales bacterium]|nr:glycosyltransferase family 4 protein [Sedimentisphaerales bacterium]
MKKHKVMFFDFVTHYGGAQQCTARLCAELKEYYNVSVADAYGCCNAYLETLSQSNVPVNVLLPEADSNFIGHRGRPFRRMVSILKQLPALTVLSKRLAKTVRQVKPDLIWTNSSKALFFLAASRCKRKCPVLMYAHGWYHKELVSPLTRILIRNCADGVLAVSNPTARALESWGVAAAKIHVVYNTVDFARIAEEGQNGVLEPVPGSDKKFKILVPAVLVQTKGQHTAVKAAGMLSAEGFDFSMYLAGDQAPGDATGYGDYLRKLISENTLAEKVFLLGWRTDIRALINYCDAVVLPTHTEGLPMSVIEPMILRRPVITTPVGGITDLIKDAQTGLLFDVDDNLSLAACLRKIMRHKELRTALADNAYQYINKCFSPARHLGLVHDALESEMDKRGNT